MTGYYDLSLVFLSYLVAILAAYSALYFGAQLASMTGSKGRLWLGLGALTMGSGVWVMHFVGMRAYVMPMPMTYDLGLTVISWFAAVLASALALYMISKKDARVVHLAISSLAMGGGIALMHYIGMEAMKMSKEPTYDPLIFVVSIGIAIVTSGAALAICRYLQGRTGFGSSILQIVASLVMGAAICGMHYTGMAAVTIPAGAMPDPDNLLSGDWLGLPLALAGMALIGMALLASFIDLRKREATQAQADAEEERMRQMAFVDSGTGLPNRSAFDRYLLDQIVQQEGTDRSFGLIYLEIANYREVDSATSNDNLSLIADTLKGIADSQTYLARYSTSGFMIVIRAQADRRHDGMYHQLRQLSDHPQLVDMKLDWRAGCSAFPLSGRSSRMLVRVATQTSDIKHVGIFEDLDVAYANPLSVPLTS